MTEALSNYLVGMVWCCLRPDASTSNFGLRFVAVGFQVERNRSLDYFFQSNARRFVFGGIDFDARLRAALKPKAVSARRLSQNHPNSGKARLRASASMPF